MLSLFSQTRLAEIVTFCAQFFTDRDPSSLVESETEPITEQLRELGYLVMGVEGPPWIELWAVSVMEVVVLGIGVNKAAERGVRGESSKRIIVGEIKCRIRRISRIALLAVRGCRRRCWDRVGGLIFFSCFSASFERWDCEGLSAMLELREVVDCEKLPAVKGCWFCTLWRRRRQIFRWVVMVVMGSSGV
ncbi:hypothetical protein Adt_15281 [Abeliophyllum distichum]|uniref:Uncharacterized protein n=1 Tax=Abeliophyllum distichum TaxID=126358 RepID=A0ABD1U236_9LAMI